MDSRPLNGQRTEFRERFKAQRTLYVDPYTKTPLPKLMDGFIEHAPRPQSRPAPPTSEAVRTVSKAHPASMAPVSVPSLPRQMESLTIERPAKPAKGFSLLQKFYSVSLQSRIISSMALCLLIAGVFVSLNSFHTNKKVIAQAKVIEQPMSSSQPATQEDNGADTPSETPPPPASVPYVVAPDLPKYFKISSLHVNARVKRVGVTAAGALDTPKNIYDVGWYDGSAKPGQTGTVVVDGHVSGPTQHGVFYDIKKLKEGDKVQIQRGDNTMFTYTVTGSQVYDADNVDMVRVMKSSVEGKNGLNFITCTGRYNSKTKEFEQRVVVFAVQDS